MKYTIIGLIFDLIDWIGIGIFPGLGDIVDLVASVYWYREIGPMGLASAIELVPGLDILPTNLALGIYADYIKEKGKEVK